MIRVGDLNVDDRSSNPDSDYLMDWVVIFPTCWEFNGWRGGFEHDTEKPLSVSSDKIFIICLDNSLRIYFVKEKKKSCRARSSVDDQSTFLPTCYQPLHAFIPSPRLLMSRIFYSPLPPNYFVPKSE